MIRPSLTLASLSLFSLSTCFSNVDYKDSVQSHIEFEQLTATLSEKIIHFSWDVQTERSGNYFLIEKSIDESNWKPVKQVNSIKNHNQKHTYHLSQINLAENVYEYFRLLRIDVFGNRTELDRVDISHPVLQNLLVFPISKATKKNCVVSYSSLICCDGKVLVKNKEGKTIYRKRLHFEKGYNRINIATKGLEQEIFEVLIVNEYGDQLLKPLDLSPKRKSRTKF